MWGIYLVGLMMALYLLVTSGLSVVFFLVILGIMLIKYLKSLEHRLTRLEIELKNRPLNEALTPHFFNKPDVDNFLAVSEIENAPLQKDTEVPRAYADNLDKFTSSSPLNQHNEALIKTKVRADTSTWIDPVSSFNEAHEPPVEDFTEQTDDFVTQINSWIKTTLFAMNPIALIGVVILFIGVAFLLKYASTYIHFSIEMRLFAIALAALSGLIWGWRLYPANPVFANILEGCSVGLLFLITYSAFKVYGLLPALPAFIILLSIVLYSSILSILHDAKSLAVLAVLGGFFSPLLISTAEGSSVLLFSYYVILNLGILGLAWFKSWSQLNLIGFIFTFTVSSLWGWQSYQPHYFYVSEFFLLLFFLFYVAIAILYAANKARQSQYYIDAIITVGTPFIVLILQEGLVAHWEYGFACSALGFGAFYAVLALVLYNVQYPALKRLVEVFTALALILVTAAIPLASTGSWAIITWVFEGIILMYLGTKDNQLRLRISAAFLEVGSDLLFLFHYSLVYFIVDVTRGSWFDIFYITAGIIGLASIICSCMWYRVIKKCASYEQTVIRLLFIWGLLWWYVNGIGDVTQHLKMNYVVMGYTLFFAVSSLIFWVFAERFRWSALRYLALTLLPMMLVFELSSLNSNLGYSHMMMGAWVISFIVLYGILYRHNKIASSYLPFIHIASILLLTCTVADQASKAIDSYSGWPDTWQYITWGIVPASLLFVINQKKIPYLVLYSYAVGGILSMFLLGWTVTSYCLSGNVSPLLYIPVLNPLELVEAFALFVAMTWFVANKNKLHVSFGLNRKSFFITCSLLVFLFLNTIILRAMHHWLAIPYTVVGLWYDSSVQACLSIFWMLLALISTFKAARNHSRMLWFSGFILIGVVLVKLFFIDLSNSSSMERILTFITVGILMLINGYISPMPPKEES